MLEQLTELRETCFLEYYIINDTIEDTNEQNKDIEGPLSLWSLGVPPSWHVSVFIDTQFPEPHTFGIFVEPTAHGYDPLVNQFLAPLLYRGEHGLKYQALFLFI